MAWWIDAASQLAWLPWVAAALFGLLVGSFLNVVIYRLPVMMQNQWQADCAELRGETSEQHPAFTLSTPRSRCPSCKTQVSAADNLPIISYLLLGGRCRHCQSRISLRYPLVELAAAGLAVACVAKFGGIDPKAWLYMLFCWALLAGAMIDLDHQLLPDNITLPLLWLGLLVNLNGYLIPLEVAVIGAIAGYMSLWLVFQAFKLITGKQGMGYGDFKLVAAMGAWLGWAQLPLIILLSSVIGAIIGVFMLRIQKQETDKPIPFGPYLALAGLISLFFGETIIDQYLSMSGLR